MIVWSSAFRPGSTSRQTIAESPRTLKDLMRWCMSRQLGQLAFLSFSHALPPYGRVVCFQTLDVSMTRFRTTGKAVERPMPLRRPGGE